MEELVVLVDKTDREIGVKEKLAAHRDNDLHRAISVFLFNSKGELMLQQRAQSKYHSGGLWTNTCCSHPRPNEAPLAAANRRLQEEMGIQCRIEKKLEFLYQAPLDNNLFEHEFDHVYVGEFNGEPQLNRQEAMNWKWVNPDTLQKEIQSNSQKYSAWLKILSKNQSLWKTINTLTRQEA